MGQFDEDLRADKNKNTLRAGFKAGSEHAKKKAVEDENFFSGISKLGVVSIDKAKRKELRDDYEKTTSYTPNHTFNIPSVIREEILAAFICPNTSDLFEHIFARGIKYYIDNPTDIVDYTEGFYGVVDAKPTERKANKVTIYGRGSRKDITPMTFSVSRSLWHIFVKHIEYQNKGVAFNHLLARGLSEYKKSGSVVCVEFTDGIAGIDFD